MDLISVVVPVYRVEPYLDRCVASIVNQTYRNLEIILVDDGSPDRCPAMCDAWAEKDRRIKVIHKANGGLSDARNAGMAVASGELMGFVDSDDWINPEMYQLLYENMMENDSDISGCGVEMVWEDDTEPRRLTKRGTCVMAAKEAMQATIEETWIQAPVWYKLYKTSLIQDITFPIGRCHEDAFWTYQAVGRAKKVSVFEKECYYYFQRAGSIMGSSFSIKNLDALEAKLLRIQYVQRIYPDLTENARHDLAFYCLWLEQRAIRAFSGEEKKRGTKIIEDVWSAIGDVRPRSSKEWLWLSLASVSLPATAKLRNLIHVGL